MSDETTPAPRFDIHVHLAGMGTQGSGCWTSPTFCRRPTFVGLRLLLGITERQMATTIDQDWAAWIAESVAASEIDRAVVLGFDGVYGADGRLDLSRSQLIVPARWVFAVCARYGNLLPGPSIHPYRPDAMDRLDEAIENGATLIKWLPIVQAIDPGSARARPFLRRMAEAGIPLLVHAGSGEVTFATVDPQVGSIDRLRFALETGVKVICAHGAARVLSSFQTSEVPLLRTLLRAHQNLWIDNSGLANPSRFPYLPRFAEDPVFAERTLNGSDFPVPASPQLYPRRLGLRRIREIQAEHNPFQREVRIKRAIGFDEASFTRAAGVLANLDRWS